VLLPAPVEGSPAGVQRSNELVDKFGQPLRIGLVCRQLAEASPLFFATHSMNKGKIIAKVQGKGVVDW